MTCNNAPKASLLTVVCLFKLPGNLTEFLLICLHLHKAICLMGIACTGCLSGVDCCIISFKALCTQLQKHKLPVLPAHHQQSFCALVQHHKVAQAVGCSCGKAFVDVTLHLRCSKTSTASAKIPITCPRQSQGCCNTSTRPTRQGQHLPESSSPVQ